MSRWIITSFVYHYVCYIGHVTFSSFVLIDLIKFASYSNFVCTLHNRTCSKMRAFVAKLRTCVSDRSVNRGHLLHEHKVFSLH